MARSTNDLELVVLRVLQQAGQALGKREIIDAVAGQGIDRAVAEAKWGNVRDRLRSSGQIVADKANRWRAEQLSPAQAFGRLVAGRLSKADRALIEIVQSALVMPPSSPSSGPPDADMHAARALAEMAIEVEELVAKQASAKAITHRVRARMKRMRLEPIDQAGDDVAFDRQRHQPIGSDIRDGTSVRVVRPGYVWKTPEKDVLIERAVVQE